MTKLRAQVATFSYAEIAVATNSNYNSQLSVSLNNSGTSETPPIACAATAHKF